MAAGESAHRDEHPWSHEGAEGLRLGPDFHRGVLDALFAHIAIVDEDGRILAVNRAWRDFARGNGLRLPGAGVGTNYFAACRTDEGPEDADARAAVDGIRTVLAGRAEEFVLEYPCHSAQEERWFVLRATSLGTIGRRCAVIAHENISQRKMAEIALQESEARFRAVFDDVAVGMLVGDADGNIVEANRALRNMLGYRSGDFPRATLADLAAGGAGDAASTQFQRMLATGASRYQMRTQLRRADGSSLEALVTLSLLFEPSGRPHLVIAMVEDLTERLEMQASLTQAERLASLGELAAGVAHEVNNPLGTMINSAQLLKDGDTDPELLDYIIEEGQRIAGIIRKLLHFAQGEGGPAADRAAALPEVIDRTLGFVRESMRRHGIEIFVDWSEHLPRARIDSHQLTQVVLNLLINAKDALIAASTARAPMITITGRNTRLGERVAVELEVRDNGPGVPPDKLPRIFEPFFTTKRAHGGTGLGLSICRRIIEDHGGRIDAASRLDEFARFRVVLPASGEDGG